MAARAFRDGDRLTVSLDGLTMSYFLQHERHRLAGRRRAGDGAARAGAAHRARRGRGRDGVVTSPMPGTVTVVQVSVGDEVTAGTPLLVVEAMKMEHVLTAPVAGTVAELG